jgi:tetratricopeptide (TPR) repeat protein
MSRRLGTGIVAALLVGGCLSLAGCAPALAPVPVVAAPRYPDFVFPVTPPRLATRDLVLRQQRGWQFLQAGDLRLARREFTAAVRRDGRFYPAEAGLAYVSLAEKDYAGAAGRFEKILRIDARYVPALVGRGDALVGAGQVDEAIRTFQAALEVDGALADVHRRLDVLTLRSQQESLTAARAAAEAGRYDEAAEAYRRAIARSPESGFLYRELAGVERKQGRAEAAVGHLGKAASIDPSDVRTLVLLGEVLEEQGEYSRAADAYARAEALEPGEEAAARVARARARADLARLPEQYRAIPGAPQLTRGDLAALVGVRLATLLTSAPARDAIVVTDVRSHWASPWIMAVVRAGVMEPFANHTFQPRAVVRRMELAEVASRVLNLLAAARPGLSRDWVLGRPRIADLPPGNLGYPAVATVVAAGVMPLADGLFRPARPVSGAEAVEVVERLEGLAR